MSVASILRNRRLQWYASGVYALLLLVGSLSPGRNLPTIPDWGLLFSPDKVAHFGAYGLFAVLLSVNLTKRRGGFGIVLAVLLSAAFGLLMEILQGVSGTGREYDPVDMVANLLGAMLGGLLFLAIYRIRNKHSQR